MLSEALHDFFHMLQDAGPAFLVALLLSAGVLVMTHRSQWLQGLLRRIGGSLPLATGVGAILPGCALGTLPLALVLRQNGARVGTLTAFMVTSAVIGPSSIILTSLLLDWQLAFLRLILPLGAVLILGGFLNFFARSRLFTMPPLAAAAEATKDIPAEPVGCCAHHGEGHHHDGHEEEHDHHRSPEHVHHEGCGHGHNYDHSSYWGTLFGICKTLVPLLLLGLFAASLLRLWIPESFVHNWLQQGSVAYLAAAGAGIPAYVCEGGEVPLTLALLHLGVGLGPAFTFMLTAVGTCLPTFLVAPRIIGAAATVTYGFFWVAFAVGAGLLITVLMN